MFGAVPECSGMFHVPGFIDAPLKHSIRQHKLDLNLSTTKQPLPIITNSHLNFRYLTASANL